MKGVFAGSTEGIAWSNGSALEDLEFADDTTLLSGSWEGMKILTARLEAEASKVGLRVNVAKTTIMRMAALTSTDSVEVESLPIEEVKQFCYLGSTLTNNGSCDAAIRVRLGKANATFGKLQNIWRDKKLKVTIKVRLHNAFVLPTLLYGAET